MTTDTAAPVSATPSAAPINPKYPNSGLTVEETDLLEREGWHETGFESTPPPWARNSALDSGSRLWHPKDALRECHRQLAKLGVQRELVTVGRCSIEPAPEPNDVPAVERLLSHKGVGRRFAPAYLVMLRAAVAAYAAEDFARAFALLTSPIAQPATPLDLDAVLRAIGRDHEVSFDKDGEVRVTRRAVTPCMVGLGNTLEAAVRDLAQQTIDARERERSTIRASLDVANARHDSLARLLNATTETPSR